MDLQALFSDQSPEYMRREGERIFLRLRTLKGEADRCVLMAGGRRRAQDRLCAEFPGYAPGAGA